jgi:hypothetical protein
VCAAVLLAVWPARSGAGAESDLVFAGSAAGEPFAVWVSPDRSRITQVMFYADSVRCRGRYDWVDYKSLAPVLPVGTPAPDDADYLFADAVAADGSFAATSDSNAVSYGLDVTGVVSVAMAGRLAGDSAHGTFSATMVLQKHSGSTFARCATGVLGWAVRTAPGQVFADASRRHPLTVELRPDRRRVRRLLIGVHATCRNGLEDTTTRFRRLLARAGRFSLARRWSTSQGGERMRAESHGTAVIHATIISGSYQETDTFLSRRGRVIDTCRIGPFRWTATSSPTAESRGGV